MTYQQVCISLSSTLSLSAIFTRFVVSCENCTETKTRTTDNLSLIEAVKEQVPTFHSYSESPRNPLGKAQHPALSKPASSSKGSELKKEEDRNLVYVSVHQDLIP